MKIRQFGYLRAIFALIAIVAIAVVMGAAPVPTVTTQPTPAQATIVVAPPAHYRRRETDPAVNLIDIKDAVGPPPDYNRKTHVSVSTVDAENTEDGIVSLRTYVTTHITCSAGCDDASSYTFAGLSGPPDHGDRLVLNFFNPRTAYLDDGAGSSPGHPTLSFACSVRQIEGSGTERFHSGYGPPTHEPGFGAQVVAVEDISGFVRRH